MEITRRVPKRMLRHWKWGLLVLLALALALSSGHERAERAEALVDITGEWNLKFIGGTFLPPQFSCSYQFTQAGSQTSKAQNWG